MQKTEQKMREKFSLLRKETYLNTIETHRHLFKGLFSRTTRISQHQKDKIILDFNLKSRAAFNRGAIRAI